MALPARGAWIEINCRREPMLTGMSLPARGAWIEISWEAAGRMVYPVAPRTGSMDLNMEI